MPRAAALRKVVKKDKDEGPIFVGTYDPILPSLGSIQAKHWRSMASRDTYLAEVFKHPPLIAFKRQQNIFGHLIRAKVAPAQKPHQARKLLGMKRCDSNCTACPYIIEGKSIKINGHDWKINKKLNCKSYNVV